MPDSSQASETISTQSHTPSLAKLLTKSILLTLGFLILFFVISVGAISIWGYNYISQFNQAAGLDLSADLSLLKAARYGQPITTLGRKNILILGTDSLETRGEAPPLTDTMIFLSIDFNSGSIYLLSLPRDLYSDAYQTKINALLAYGFDRYPDQPQLFPQEVISDLIGQPIHHTVVISLDDLESIIDQVGGVEVEVKTAFVDEQFPIPSVDVTQVKNPDLLYETITFEAGPELMTGERALKYIRSRHAQGEQGTDTARSDRQQQVIRALVSKILTQEVLLVPQKIGGLTKTYHDKFAKYISLVEALKTARLFAEKKQSPQFVPLSLSIYPDDDQGVIENPPLWRYDGQWVYAIKDQTQLDQEISAKLGL